MALKTFRDICLEYLKKEDIKNDMKEILKPIIEIIYDEIYIYVCIMCFYNIIFIFIVLANFILLLQLIKKNNIGMIEKYI